MGQFVVPAPDRDAEPEERMAVRVVRADLVGPLDAGLGREPVVEAAVGELRPFQETQIDEREPVEFERPCGLTGDDREGAGDVVGAVAVRDPGGVEECVLEDPGLVAQRSEMCKRRGRDALGSSQNSARFRTVRFRTVRFRTVLVSGRCLAQRAGGLVQPPGSHVEGESQVATCNVLPRQ